MFMLRIADPVNASVVSDGVVVRINADNFEVFVSSVLSNPVGVKNSETAEFASDSLLCDRAEVSRGL